MMLTKLVSCDCRQAAALLQLLNTMAGGRDVGTAVTITCQTVIKGPSTPAVKRLGYDVVRAAALTDADWDNVLSGFLTDFSPTYPSVEACYPSRSTPPPLNPALSALQWTLNSDYA